jgi:hypothetical protein
MKQVLLHTHIWLKDKVLLVQRWEMGHILASFKGLYAQLWDRCLSGMQVTNACVREFGCMQCQPIQCRAVPGFEHEADQSNDNSI